MEKGTILHGFIVDSIREIAEIKATAYQLTHLKTKAHVLWLKRDDNNKSFAIGFQTIPSDSTGVFHILEHSVLNGSEKYPLKEPFVDLIKGSLNTFLNAMTWPDKTMYPIASRNNKDFINLMRVYLDAVFAPLCISNENIFRQEGWHYELTDPDQDPLIKGVVYNEMKGAYSSPDRLASEIMTEQLFQDTSYGFSSGGDPKCIPTLTYEKFKENYHRFYNATNAKIILDGDLNLDEVLGIIDDEYLSHMEYVEPQAALQLQKPQKAQLKVCEFDATSTEDKTIIDYGYVVGKYDDYERVLAFSVLTSLLADDNQSVLKKAVLESGLAQDVIMSLDDSTFQPYLEIAVMNTNPECYEALTSLIRETLIKAADEGLNKDELRAIINSMEFKAKERDFGYAPKGIVFAMQAANWMYGGDPIDGIVNDHLYKSLKEKIDSSYFEDLIREYLINSEHCATVIAKPKVGLEGQQQAQMKEQMKAYKASLSDQQLEQLINWNRQFSKWQMSSDTPEIKATLPKLQLADIDDKPSKIEKTVSQINGTTVLEYHNNTEGIQYYSLYFDVTDLSVEELQRLTIILSLLGHLDTEKYDVSTLNRLKRNYLGAAGFAASTIEDRHSNDYRYKMAVTFSCLKENGLAGWDLIREIIYHTSFARKQDILDILKQGKNDLEMSFTYGGHQLGMTRALASCNVPAAIKEYTTGYEFFNYLKSQIDGFNDETVDSYQKLYEKLFTSNRLTVSLMAEGDHQLLDQILKDIRFSDEKLVRAQIAPLPKKREAIEIASQVSYAVEVIDHQQDLGEILGKLAVIRKILYSDYLWTQVRAMGGAYGTGFIQRRNAFVYYSYRDPNPNNAINIYNKTREYLENYCQSDDDLNTYIIGTIGDNDPLLTNITTLVNGDNEYFGNVSYEDKCLARRQVMTMNKDEIRKLLDLFDFKKENISICVVGGQQAIESCGDKIETVLHL